MTLRFYIALYNINEPASFHWALFAVPGNDSITGRVHMFQITTQKPGQQGEDGYMAAHGSFRLLGSGNFICAIRLPSLNMTMPELEEFMALQYVGRRGSTLIDTPNKRWSCFQWAMRAIQDLISAGSFIPESSRSFFTRNAAMHPKWGAMMHVAGTVAAHNARNNNQVDWSSGVPQMSLESSSIFL